MPVLVYLLLLLVSVHVIAWSVSNCRRRSHFLASLGMALKYEPDKKVHDDADHLLVELPWRFLTLICHHISICYQINDCIYFIIS